MKQQLEKLKLAAVGRKRPFWAKLLLRSLAILVSLLVVFALSVIWYVNSHKKEVLVLVTEKLNENINGNLSIESMEPTFLEGFPRISLHLKNVVIRDTMFAKHQKTLLQAGDFDIAVNALAFIRGSVEINKISISNASVNLFTDANGYSNTNVFKSNVQKGNDSPVYPELRKFELENVSFAIDNQSRHKLFQFVVEKINGKMESGAQGWKVDFTLKALVKSLAFSTKKGSFIKEKIVDGDFEIQSNAQQKSILVLENKLDIGGADFKISAEFKTKADLSTDYAIHIVNDKILWKTASRLLTPNISSRLDLFGLKVPIAVRCDISGNFNEEGDPFILVNAKIRNNELSTPGGLVSDCNFNGVFTNNEVVEKGFNDANSAIKFEKFTGTYAGMPFTMNHAAILDLEKPFAKGDFKSKFGLKQLGNIINPKLLKFTSGTADVNLNFIADIVNYTLTKPIVTGTVAVNDGGIFYTPRKMSFTKTSVLLDFRNSDLFISNIHLQTGRSVVNMEGDIRNFLNLYYTAPEKVVLNWNINSPEIRLSELIGFVGKRNISKTPRKRNKNADFTEDINLLFEKSKVNVTLRVKRLFYNKFLATNVSADLLLSDSGISVQNGALNNSDGYIKFNGNLKQSGALSQYQFNAIVNHVNVSKFFYAFDNFGLTSMDSENLKGFLSAETGLTGKIRNDATLVPNAMTGKVVFDISRGALINFDPVRKIGKYAFPRRDMNNIMFQSLNGKFDISGEQVAISPMQINSSVLNMDIDGLYSFGKGTNINISVPLRNPEKDKDIYDTDELAKRRERGVVIRLQAADGDDGKVKIKLVSKKSQLQQRNGAIAE